MKLKVTVVELLSLINDTSAYAKHSCKEYDSCCYVCACKRITEANNSNELEIEECNEVD